MSLIGGIFEYQCLDFLAQSRKKMAAASFDFTGKRALVTGAGRGM